jgi:hypothetical protein
LVWYFPADAAHSLSDVLAPDVAAASASSGTALSYADVFASFMSRLAAHLDPQVVEQVSRVLALMKDGRPCPASQVAVGSFAVAAMATSMIHDVLAGKPVPSSPKLVVHSFSSMQTRVVDLSAG